MIIDSNAVINIELPRRRGLHYSHHKEEMVIMEGDRALANATVAVTHALYTFIKSKCCVS